MRSIKFDLQLDDIMLDANLNKLRRAVDLIRTVLFLVAVTRGYE